jgi:hypothetical protein
MVGEAWTIASLSVQSGSANAINSLGTVVGVSGGFASVWTTGGQTTLGPFAAVATGINSAGTVVGYRTDIQPHQAVFWVRSGTGYAAGEQLSTMPSGTCNSTGNAYSSASAIAEDGTIAGDGCHQDGTEVALLWPAQTPEGPWAGPEIVNAGTPTLRGAALALNSTGQIAGTLSSQDPCCNFEPVIWDASGNVTRLGLFTGHTRGINEAGQAVGFYQPRINRSFRPFLWTPGSGRRDLAAAGEANGINGGTSGNGPVLAVGSVQLSRGGAPVVWTIPVP